MRFSIPGKYKPFLLPVLTFVVILVLSLTLGRFLVDKVFETRQKNAELQDKNKLLEGKADLLSTLDAEGLKKQVNIASSAIPSDNPSVLALSQIRTLAQENGLLISSFQIGESQEPKKTGRVVAATANVEGSIFSIISFLRTIENSTPLLKITDLKLTLSGGSVLAKATVVSSWNPLPSELGKVDSPISGISGTEQELLGKLSGLRLPQISQSPVGQPAGKPDPFAF